MKRFFSLIALLVVCATGSVSAAAVADSQAADRHDNDTLSVLCIGNSFTFFFDSEKRLEEIAASEGHGLKAQALTVGGYTFHRHLIDDKTMGPLVYNQYDLVFLQDQSRTPALYGEDPKCCRLVAEDARELAERVRIYSPHARVWIEQTWSYENGNYGGFGSFERFDQLLKKGARLMAKKAHTEVSPIGDAFAIVRAERPDINLYYPDNKHQSELGTYLKSCVNYLLIYGQPFSANTTSCGYDAEKCNYLRKVAERVVLGR